VAVKKMDEVLLAIIIFAYSGIIFCFGYWAGKD